MNDFTNGQAAAQPPETKEETKEEDKKKEKGQPYAEAAKELGFPVHGAAWLVKTRIIPPLLDTENRTLLFVISRIYKLPGFLKIGLGQLPVRERYRLVATAGMQKWESYVFSRYFNLKPNVRLRVKDVRDEVKAYYKAKKGDKMSDEQIDARIRSIRNQAYQARFKERAKLAEKKK